jgi:fatty acid desaturase
VLVLLTAAATSVPALLAIALVAAVWIGLHAYELIHWREGRAQRRSTDDLAGQTIESQA